MGKVALLQLNTKDPEKQATDREAWFYWLLPNASDGVERMMVNYIWPNRSVKFLNCLRKHMRIQFSLNPCYDLPDKVSTISSGLGRYVRITSSLS